MARRPQPELKIVDASFDDVEDFENNPRIHPKRQLEMLAASIAKHGFNNPILLAPKTSKSGKYPIIAGHARVVAAKQLLMTSVPAIILAHLNKAQQRAYRLADNAIPLKGEWCPELLARELEFVMNCDFEPLEIGFEMGEIDFIIEDNKTEEAGAEPVLEPDRSVAAVSRVGDIWNIGEHRVGCGDSLNLAFVTKVMKDQLAGVIISDMPFNVAVAGHIGGLGKIKHREFVMASGEMSESEFAQMMTEAFRVQAACGKPGALVYEFIDWRSEPLMRAVGEKIFGPALNVCIWVKPAGAMGSLYRSRYEMIVVFRVPGAKHVNNVLLGKHGRNRTNVWEYASPGGFGSERKNLALHPSVKNKKMIADAIMDSTHRGDIVLDAFLGSGTTVLAAHEVGRIGYGVELDPAYVDLAIQRISEAVGKPPILDDGRPYEAVKADREAEGAW
ncbi:MAG: DNA methyltransferase [Planctomycetota bacterium]